MGRPEGTPKTLDIVSVAEIAEMAGVSKQIVNNWRRRSKDMPSPAAELRCGPIWLRREIKRWLISIGFTHLRR